MLLEEDTRSEYYRRLESFALSLLSKRDEAVQWRRAIGVEKRWREDEKAFEGDDDKTKQDMVDYATGEAIRTARDAGKEPRRSRVVVNIIRGRCETAEGRFSDIMLPTDDRNWGLKVTPDPTLSEQLQDNRLAMQAGQPITDQRGNQKKVSEVAQDKMMVAKKKMERMETVINDQTVECDYNGEVRLLIQQAIKLGTGVIKGPSVIKSLRKKWQRLVDGDETVYQMMMEEQMQPGSRWVDVWNLYPSPGTKQNIQKTCEYMFEYDEMLPRDVKALAGTPGYYQEQIAAVLEEQPLRTTTHVNKNNQTSIARERIQKGKAYEVWEYNGEANKEDLEALGCDCEGAQFKSVSICAVFINDRPVKIELNPIDSGEIPYDFFPWTTVNNDSPYGYGIPRMMIWLQGIVTGAWRSMMDNAGDSSGSMVVMSKSLYPADGIWEIGGKKLFITEDDLEDARKAFAMFQMANVQPQLQNIIELALRFVDLETSLPTIFQAEAQEIPETLGATNIMVDSSNVGLRHRVKLFDDRVTDPHMTRYYAWNMLYNDDDEIKGDFSVDARGVSVLLEKDQQAQLLLQVFGLKGDPDIERIVDWEKASQQFFSSRRLDILKSDQDLEAYDNAKREAPEAPTDPRVAAAQITAQAQIDQRKIQAESDMAELEFKAAEAQRQREHQQILEQMRLQVKMMDYASREKISLEKLKTQLAISGKGMELQRELSGDKATPEVIEPPTEPAGRAPTGQSFER
jgi:hypothetical protein